MIRSTLQSWLVLTALCAVGTVLVAWWAVPIISAIWALALPRRGGVLTATAAGACAWGLLLAVAARNGRIDDVAELTGAILGTSALAVVALTVLYGALLAGSAALVARAIIPVTARRSHTA
jgi:hypothetical protein